MVTVKNGKIKEIKAIRQIFKFDYEWNYCKSKLEEVSPSKSFFEDLKDWGWRRTLYHHCVCHNKVPPNKKLK
jgi:hypothetical protein